MAWKLKRDPLLDAIPTFKHPERCHNCGHLTAHDPVVGCLEPGGTKYIINEDGEELRACSCTKYVPVPPELLEFEAAQNIIRNSEIAKLKEMSIND